MFSPFELFCYSQTTWRRPARTFFVRLQRTEVTVSSYTRDCTDRSIKFSRLSKTLPISLSDLTLHLPQFSGHALITSQARCDACNQDWEENLESTPPSSKTKLSSGITKPFAMSKAWLKHWIFSLLSCHAGEEAKRGGLRHETSQASGSKKRSMNQDEIKRLKRRIAEFQEENDGLKQFQRF